MEMCSSERGELIIRSSKLLRKQEGGVNGNRAKSPLLHLIDKYFSGRTEKETPLLGLHTLF